MLVFASFDWTRVSNNTGRPYLSTIVCFQFSVVRSSVRLLSCSMHVKSMHLWNKTVITFQLNRFVINLIRSFNFWLLTCMYKSYLKLRNCCSRGVAFYRRQYDICFHQSLASRLLRLFLTRMPMPLFDVIKRNAYNFKHFEHS